MICLFQICLCCKSNMRLPLQLLIHCSNIQTLTILWASLVRGGLANLSICHARYWSPSRYTSIQVYDSGFTSRSALRRLRVARMVKSCQVRKVEVAIPHLLRCLNTIRQKTGHSGALDLDLPYMVYRYLQVEYTKSGNCTHTSLVTCKCQPYLDYLIRDKYHFSDLINLFVFCECMLDRSGHQGR